MATGDQQRVRHSRTASVAEPAARKRLGGADDDLVTRAESRLREATVFLDSIVENIPHMIFVKDAEELRFERINRAGEALLGVPRDKLLGRTDRDFFPREQADFFQEKDREVLRGRIVVDVAEEPINTPHGVRWLHTKKIPLLGEDGEPAYLLGISEDITEQRELAGQAQRAQDGLELQVATRTGALLRANEELQREIQDRQHAEAALQASEDQLRQGQKMEAIGRLAGGVAHDFNNLLSVIVGYSQVLATELRANDALREFAGEIRTAGLRAAELTKQLLAFGRQQVLLPRILDLNEVLLDMTRMLERIIGEDIELRLVPAVGLGLTRLDPSQFEQVVMNLVVNARDAMPGGGTLTLETRNVEADADFAREHLGVLPGSYVMLAVTDDGSGMDAGTKARIFEPFFTTKEKGKGTGLGLSTVFGIVQQSGGSIWVYSEPGHGTSFKLYFPRASDDEAAPMPMQKATLPEERASETVLLVEDDAQVRGLIRNVLGRSGYEVLEANSASAALELCSQFGGRIHLLLTDVVMPKMSGRELAAQLLRTRPDMKVLFMSGYADSPTRSEGPLPAGLDLVQKPIAPDVLTRRIRDMLGEA